jgi:hypothetical protein
MNNITPVPKTPVPKTPVPKTPVPKTPVPKTPVPKTPASKILSTTLSSVQNIKTKVSNVANKTVEYIKSNPVVFYSIIVCVGILILYLLYVVYNKIRNSQLKQPIIIRNPLNSKTPLVLTNTHIPISNHGYSITYWLLLDDWSYQYGKWKHVLHKGDPSANIVQPGIWLHPTRNELYIAFDTNKRQTGYAPFQNNRTYSSVSNPTYINKTNSITNTTLGKAKQWCSSNPQCKGFSTLLENPQDNNSKVIVASYPPMNDNAPLVQSPPREIQALGNMKLMEGTFEKNNSLPSMSPLVNTTNMDMYTVVKNIPLNRWFNVGIVVNVHSAEIYIDGELVETRSLNNSAKENNGHLYVNQNGGFSGMTTQLRYYDTPITSQKMKYIYYLGPNPFMLPSLTGLQSKITSNSHLNITLGNKTFGF